MLFREETQGRIAITQLTHAWLSGQLARAWGNARDGYPSQLLVTPWPFRHEQVTLVYEGRRLAATFSDETRMREALMRAPWVTLQTTLLPKQTE